MENIPDKAFKYFLSSLVQENGIDGFKIYCTLPRKSKHELITHYSLLQNYDFTYNIVAYNN
ncbi:MAG: hypothetical protein F6K47_42150 [Symploca sp. SIO2E6]|nr:hypothetical protein [Symploca sp. SIO2E6]